MIKYLPQVGQNVRIVKETFSGEVKSYETQITDIHDDNIMCIAMPIHRSVIIPFSIGEKIDLFYNVENFGQYTFKVEVTGRKKDNIVYMTVKRISSIKKFQRRNYYRISISKDIELKKLDSDYVEDSLTVNISGGGMKLLTNQTFKKNELVEIRTIIENQYSELIGKVITFAPTQTEGKYSNELAVEFVGISEELRNDIVKFVFKTERDILKKGM